MVQSLRGTPATQSTQTTEQINMSAPVKVSDLFAAELENLKRSSEESDRKIAEHLKKLHQHLDEMKAIELDTVTD